MRDLIELLKKKEKIIKCFKTEIDNPKIAQFLKDIFEKKMNLQIEELNYIKELIIDKLKEE